MLNRLYIVIGLLAILALSAAFIVPRFVQWGDYRERMEAIGSEVLGAPVEIVGDIEFTLLPQPALLMSEVVVGPSASPAITVRHVEAQFSLVDFIRDRYRITKLILDQPVLAVSIDAAGQFVAGIALAEQVTNSNVSVASAEVVNGEVRLADARSGETFATSNIDGELRLDAPRGPFAFQGNGDYAGATYVLRFTTDAADAEGNTQIAASARRPATGFSLVTEGNLAAGPAPDYVGTMTYRQAPARLADAGADIGRGDLVVSGKVEATPARILLPEFEIVPDENRAASRLLGAAEITLGSDAAFDAAISGVAMALPPRDATAEQQEAAPYELVRLLAELPLPVATGLAGRAAVNIGELDLRVVSLRALQLDATTDGENWSIQSLTAQLPGNTDLRFAGEVGVVAERPEFAGDLKISSRQLAGLAQLWRKPATGNPLLNVPGSLQARASLVGETLSLSDGHFELDDVSHSFSSEVGFAEGTRHFNIEADLGAMDAADSNALLALLPDPTQDAQFGVTFPRGRVDVAAEQATLAGMSGTELEAVGNWEGGVLVLDRLSAIDLGGAAFDVEATAFGTIARPEFSGSGSVRIGSGDALILEHVFNAVSAPQQVRALLARSLPAEVELLLGAPSGDGGQGLMVSGRAGAAEIAVQAELSMGVLRALQGPLSLNLEMQSDDPTAMTAQLGLGDRSLVPEDAMMRLVAVMEGTASNSFGTTLRIEGGGDQLGFAGNVVVADPEEWSGSGAVKLALSDASVLMEQFGAGGIGVPAFSGSADVSFRGARNIELEAIEAQSGEQPVTGALALTRAGDSSVVSGALEVGRIDAASMLAVLAGPAALIGGSDGPWPNGPLDLGPALRDVGGRISITTPMIAADGRLAVSDARFDLAWDAGAVRIRDLVGTLGGGQLQMQLGLCCAGPLQDKRLSGRLTLDGVAMDAIAPAAVAATLEGSIDATAQFEGTGDSVSGLLAAMTGEGSYVIEGLQIADLDPTAFEAIGGMDAILELEREQLSDTIINRLDDGTFIAAAARGSFTIAGGVLRSPNLAIEGPDARLFGSTTVQLADLALGGGYVMSPTGAREGDDELEQATTRIVANLEGTLTAPERVFDVSGMVDGLMVRAYEQEVARLEQLRAEDEARQRAAAAERARIAAEIAAQEEAARRAEAEAAAREAEAAAEAEAQAAEEAAPPPADEGAQDPPDTDLPPEDGGRRAPMDLRLPPPSQRF